LSTDKPGCYLELVPAPRDRHIPDLVSATEAAEMLGVTRQAVQLMANNGQLPGAKVGNTWVFRRVLVERAADERKANG
jgi:excisionase family DNA binding protein